MKEIQNDFMIQKHADFRLRLESSNTQATTTKNKLATLSGLFNHLKRKLARVTMLKIHKALAMPIMYNCNFSSDVLHFANVNFLE